LNALRGINEGNHMIQKLQRAIRIATKLVRMNLGDGRDSFIDFLTKEAFGERTEKGRK
jgi:hypothetical protein